MAKKSNWDDGQDFGSSNQYSNMYNQYNPAQMGYDPTDARQLPPVVQPLVIVPYSTQMQPLVQFSPEQMMMGGQTGQYGQYGQDTYTEDAEPRIKKQVSAAAILLMLLSLLTIAVLVIGKFVDLAMLNIYKDMNGLTKILELPDLFSGELVIKSLIIPAGLAGVALFSVLVLLFSLFSIKSGPSIILKVFAVLQLVFAVLVVIMLFIDKYEIEIGAYALAGLSVLTLLFALLGKRRRS